MIVLDTSGLLAALDATEAQHAAARRAMEEDRGPFLLSPFVAAEVDYLLATRHGTGAELRFLGEVARRAYALIPFGGDEVGAAARVIERYRALGIGLADASLVVIAAGAGTTRLLTLDERHFRAIRPLRGKAFTLLPRDA